MHEIRRVLRPGGRHVFTVPINPELGTSRSREGQAPEYHGRGGGPFALVTRKADMLAHTDFGTDLPDWLDRAGFACEVLRLRDRLASSSRRRSSSRAAGGAGRAAQAPARVPARRRICCTGWKRTLEAGRVGVMPAVEHRRDRDERGRADPLAELSEPDVVHVDAGRERQRHVEQIPAEGHAAPEVAVRPEVLHESRPGVELRLHRRVRRRARPRRRSVRRARRGRVARARPRTARGRAGACSASQTSS